VWIHGASVGEARIVREAARRLRQHHPRRPISVSAYTRSGRAQLPAPPEVDAAFFMPLDFPGYPSRVLRAVRPALLVLVETELWPNLLHEASALGVPVAVINGRLAPARIARYRGLGPLYRPLMAGLARVCAQSPEDAARFEELGVPRSALTVTGNLKYDLPMPEVDRARLRARLGLEPDRPVVVAGSTGPGEESLVLEAFVAARSRVSQLFLVLAPRHPERAAEIEREAGRHGVHLPRSSADWRGRADGLLVDTLGELSALYAIASVAFVGGSLVPVGGHNVLEPAAHGVPVLFGPYTQNIREPAQAMLEAGAAERVEGAADLAERWVELARDPERRARAARAAARLLDSGRGAMERTLTTLDRLLQGAA
jgi:3-deoxy-D-manno-octulosonic-acid transferase